MTADPHRRLGHSDRLDRRLYRHSRLQRLSATKAALRSYSRTWTREFNDRGIRFNTLSPGPIDTPMLDGQADKAKFAAAVPLNRLGRPEEIAAAGLFSASDDSNFVAGVESTSMAAWPRSNHRADPRPSSRWVYRDQRFARATQRNHLGYSLLDSASANRLQESSARTCDRILRTKAMRRAQ